MTDREILKSSLATTPHCLSPEQLEVLAQGKQTDPHVDGCPRCQTELALLKRFISEEPLADEGAAVGWISARLDRQRESFRNPSRVQPAGGETQPSWWARTLGFGTWRWALPLTMAAAVIVAVAVFRGPKEPELRANLGQSNPVYRSQQVQLTAPLGDLSQIPQTLQWQAFPGAKTYLVEVMEVDDSRLWAADSKETSVEIPAALRAKMLPGKPLRWRVTALDGQSQVLATSQVQRFAVTRVSSSEKDRSSQ